MTDINELAMRLSAAEGGEVLDEIDAEDCRKAAEALTAQQQEIERLAQERDGAVSTLKALFDRRKLVGSRINEAVLGATRGYLRRCENGGMPSGEANAVEAVVADMARLSIFADLFIRYAMPEGDDPIPLNPMETAPKDRPILVWHDHRSDSYVEDRETGRLTRYGAWCEGDGHEETPGLYIARWGGGFEEDQSGEGWGPWAAMPDWWFKHDDPDHEQPLAPVGWLPLPVAEKPAPVGLIKEENKDG